MIQTLLHIVDPTTDGDALEMLSHLLARPDQNTTQHLLILGHLHTKTLLALANVDLQQLQSEKRLHTIRSLGWADPSGWRALRRLASRLQPHILQTWGLPSTVAATTCPLPVQRIAVITHPPTVRHCKLLRLCERRGNWSWVTSSSTLMRYLATHGLDTARLTRIRPGVALHNLPPNSRTPSVLKTLLEIRPDEGPIILLAGDGYYARHDFGLWAIAIAQQLFPRIRVIVREPSRGRNQGLDRLLNLLPDNHMTVVAPQEIPWHELVRAADICLVTAVGPVEVSGVLHAFAGGLPVIGLPTECVGELVEHNLNGLISKEMKPRSLAARVEEYMADSTLKWRLTDHARAQMYEEFSVSKMIDSFAALWRTAPVSAVVSTSAQRAAIGTN